MVSVKLQDPVLAVYLDWGCGVPEIRGSLEGMMGNRE